MFEAKRMLYIYAETPLHVGTGRGLGGIDLPIQRERTTGYPIVYAGGLKGCLRAATSGGAPANHIITFGPETSDADAHAGALVAHDARILLFPVRSLAGVYAWTTSVDVLQRFLRAADLAGTAPAWGALPVVTSGEARVPEGSALVCAGKVVLEDFTFTPVPDALVNRIGDWLAENALPADPVYAYWRAQLPLKLCVLPDEAFRDFARLSTEVATRVQLAAGKKTVAQGPWTEEYLPVDTLLYAPLLASRARSGAELSGAQILDWVAGEVPARLQLGGDETIGRGIVHLRFGEGGEA